MKTSAGNEGYAILCMLTPHGRRVQGDLSFLSPRTVVRVEQADQATALVCHRYARVQTRRAGDPAGGSGSECRQGNHVGHVIARDVEDLEHSVRPVNTITGEIH